MPTSRPAAVSALHGTTAPAVSTPAASGPDRPVWVFAELSAAGAHLPLGRRADGLATRYERLGSPRGGFLS